MKSFPFPYAHSTVHFFENKMVEDKKIIRIGNNAFVNNIYSIVFTTVCRIQKKPLEEAVSVCCEIARSKVAAFIDRL